MCFPEEEEEDTAADGRAGAVYTIPEAVSESEITAGSSMLCKVTSIEDVAAVRDFRNALAELDLEKLFLGESKKLRPCFALGPGATGIDVVVLLVVLQMLFRLAGVRNPLEASFGVVILGVRGTWGELDPSVDAANAIELGPVGRYGNLAFCIFGCADVELMLVIEIFGISRLKVADTSILFCCCPQLPGMSSRSDPIPPLYAETCIIDDIDEVFDMGAAIREETEHFRETYGVEGSGVSFFGSCGRCCSVC